MSVKIPFKSVQRGSIQHRSWRRTFATLVLSATPFLSASVALAQSPVHRMGRLGGFGWGDGYHASKPSGFRYRSDLPPALPANPKFKAMGIPSPGNMARKAGATFYDHFDAGSWGGAPHQQRVHSGVCDGCSPACDQPACDQPGYGMMGQTPNPQISLGDQSSSTEVAKLFQQLSESPDHGYATTESAATRPRVPIRPVQPDIATPIQAPAYARFSPESTGFDSQQPFPTMDSVASKTPAVIDPVHPYADVEPNEMDAALAAIPAVNKASENPPSYALPNLDQSEGHVAERPLAGAEMPLAGISFPASDIELTEEVRPKAQLEMPLNLSPGEITANPFFAIPDAGTAIAGLEGTPSTPPVSSVADGRRPTRLAPTTLAPTTLAPKTFAPAFMGEPTAIVPAEPAPSATATVLDMPPANLQPPPTGKPASSTVPNLLPRPSQLPRPSRFLESAPSPTSNPNSEPRVATKSPTRIASIPLAVPSKRSGIVVTELDESGMTTPAKPSGPLPKQVRSNPRPPATGAVRSNPLFR